MEEKVKFLEKFDYLGEKNNPKSETRKRKTKKTLIKESEITASAFKKERNLLSSKHFTSNNEKKT